MNGTHPRPGSSRGRGGARLLSILLASVLLPWTISCGSSGPALQVDGAAFTKDDLLGITPERQLRLVELTALGLAYGQGEADSVAAPLVRRQEGDSLLQRFRASLVVERAGVGDDVLRAQYQTDPRYELVVRHMVALADPSAPDSVQNVARKKAQRALQRLEQGEPMSKVAAEMSEEPGASRSGGLLEPGRKGSWVPEFWRAANGLEVGQHTGVVHTQYGYHVIELEKRTVVPFEEVRSDVVLQAGRMIGGMADAWSAWRDSVSATVGIDTAAVRRWRVAPGPSAESAPPDGTSPPDSVLLAWSPGGAGGPSGPGATAVTVGDFNARAAALEESRWQQVVTGPVDGTVDELRNEAVRARALQMARKGGLRLTGAEREEIARKWRNQLATWAVTLGFRENAAPPQVKQQALEALSTSRQNASLARDEVKPRGPLLRAAYPVQGLPSETGAAGDP